MKRGAFSFVFFFSPFIQMDRNLLAFPPHGPAAPSGGWLQQQPAARQFEWCDRCSLQTYAGCWMITGQFSRAVRTISGRSPKKGLRGRRLCSRSWQLLMFLSTGLQRSRANVERIAGCLIGRQAGSDCRQFHRQPRDPEPRQQGLKGVPLRQGGRQRLAYLFGIHRIDQHHPG